MKFQIILSGWKLALALILLWVCCTLTATGYENECETMPSTIHIVKDEKDKEGRVIKSCEEDLEAMKCEGACASSVLPSVNTLSGFKKDCKCCKETHLRSRRVVLNHCYDTNGKRLLGEDGTLKFKLWEPAECKCFKCGDSTR